MSEERERLSECESILMRILWKEDCDMSMQELRAEALEDYGKDWAKQTVSTLLKRMENTGYLESYKEGRIYYYHPLVTQKEYLGEEAVKFCKTWFGGDPVAMMEAYNKKKKLTPKQKERFKNLL